MNKIIKTSIATRDSILKWGLIASIPLGAIGACSLNQLEKTETLKVPTVAEVPSEEAKAKSAKIAAEKEAKAAAEKKLKFKQIAKKFLIASMQRKIGSHQKLSVFSAGKHLQLTLIASATTTTQLL